MTDFQHVQTSAETIGGLALNVEFQINSRMPGDDTTRVEDVVELNNYLSEAYVQLRKAQQFLLKDKQRRAEEKAQKMTEAMKPFTRAHGPVCDCHGSMFSHDIDCATNIARLEAAGYRLVKIDD